VSISLQEWGIILPIGLAVLGAFLCLISILGGCAAYRKSKCLLFVVGFLWCYTRQPVSLLSLSLSLYVCVNVRVLVWVNVRVCVCVNVCVCV
jgi:hypothetical protein